MTKTINDLRNQEDALARLLALVGCTEADIDDVCLKTTERMPKVSLEMEPDLFHRYRELRDNAIIAVMSATSSDMEIIKSAPVCTESFFDDSEYNDRSRQISRVARLVTDLACDQAFLASWER